MASTTQMTAPQLDALAQALIQAHGRPFVTSIYDKNITLSESNKIQVQAMNNGSLIMFFEVTISGVITAPSTGAATLTQTGVFNSINNVSLTDYQHNTRIQNISGRDLAAYNGLSEGYIIGSLVPAYTGNTASVEQNVIATNEVPGVLSAPASVAEGDSEDFALSYLVPMARPGTFQGSLPVNVNQNVFTSTLDLTLMNATQAGGLYDLYDSGTITNVNVQVNQHSITDLPTFPDGTPVYLPVSSNTLYQLLNSSKGLALNPGSYTNFPFDQGAAYLSELMTMVASGSTSFDNTLANLSKVQIQGGQVIYDTLLPRTFVKKSRAAMRGADLFAGQLYFPLQKYKIGMAPNQPIGIGSGQWFKNVMPSTTAPTGLNLIVTSERLQMAQGQFTPTGPTDVVGGA